MSEADTVILAVALMLAAIATAVFVLIRSLD